MAASIQLAGFTIYEIYCGYTRQRIFGIKIPTTSVNALKGITEMSELHVRQIKAALDQRFRQLVDMTDCERLQERDREKVFLSRAQSAFVLTYLTEETPADVAGNITDGPQDNGLDAVYYHSSERVLYLAQSKWKSSGAGGVGRGNIQKFLKGFRDLINARWDRFNQKVQDHSSMIESALNDASTRIVLVIAYTGQDPLSDEVQQDIQDELDEVNDPSELVSVQILRQGDIYSAVAQGIEGAPIDLDVALYDWGQVREPYNAYYGQVAASDVAGWYADYQSRLFAPNIRMFLGPTEVNSTIVDTLASTPQNFWYFNNGVTALCRTISKKPIGGATKETGLFECRDLRVVNGAQTVGAIAAASRKAESSVAEARVTIRIVSLDECPPDFERQITRYNNTQNRIDRRDFVALDEQQERLRGELQLEGVQYVYKSGDAVGSAAAGFDLSEATVARACRQPDSSLAVQAKREIGRLWDNIEEAPYRILFNAGVSGPSLWRQVQLVRAVEEALTSHRKDADGRRRLLAVHGNRFITHLVMQCLEANAVDSHSEVSPSERESIVGLAEEVYSLVLELVNNHYPDAYLASLFKNASKCKHLKEHFSCPDL